LATKVSIAYQRDTALERIAQATGSISERLNVPPPVLPQFNRDRDYLHASQLEALAAWAERTASALSLPTKGGKHDTQTTTA
jgi:hypothetical protein